jgi:hypothetical protein
LDPAVARFGALRTRVFEAFFGAFLAAFFPEAFLLGDFFLEVLPEALFEALFDALAAVFLVKRFLPADPLRALTALPPDGRGDNEGVPRSELVPDSSCRDHGS